MKPKAVRGPGSVGLVPAASLWSRSWVRPALRGDCAEMGMSRQASSRLWDCLWFVALPQNGPTAS